MDIIQKTTTVVMISVHLLQITDTCGTLSSLRIQISESTALLIAEIQYFPISTFMVQNIGSTQEKQTLPQMLPFKSLLKVSSLIQFWRLLIIKKYFTYS